MHVLPLCCITFEDLKLFHIKYAQKEDGGKYIFTALYHVHNMITKAGRFKVCVRFDKYSDQQFCVVSE